jgi:hypothetical protein
MLGARPSFRVSCGIMRRHITTSLSHRPPPQVKGKVSVVIGCESSLSSQARLRDCVRISSPHSGVPNPPIIVPVSTLIVTTTKLFIIGGSVSVELVLCFTEPLGNRHGEQPRVGDAAISGDTSPLIRCPACRAKAGKDWELTTRRQ